MIVSAREFRALARRRLPRFLFDYIDGAAYDEATCARNVSDLSAVRLRQRVLRNVEGVTTSTRILGQGLGPAHCAGAGGALRDVRKTRRGAGQSRRGGAGHTPVPLDAVALFA